MANKSYLLQCYGLSSSYNILTSYDGIGCLILINLKTSTLLQFNGFNALVADLFIKGTKFELVATVVVKEFGLMKEVADLELENFLEYLLNEKILIEIK